jgi:hypothetical protein
MDITLKRKNPALTEETKGEYITWLRTTINTISQDKEDIDDSEDESRIFGTNRNDSDEVLDMAVTLLNTIEQNVLTPKPVVV